MKFAPLVALVGVNLAAPIAAQPLNVPVRAKAAILYNPKNGAILFEKGAKEPHYPASLTKMATALFVLDAKNLDLESQFIASGSALEVMNAHIKQSDPLNYPPHVLEHDGVMIGLKKGEALSLNTLLHSLLLYSSCDAANVIAEGCSGRVETFMEEMNAYLREKGITQTRFQNPHGLHHPAQLTTALDIAKIAGLAFENALFMEIDQTPYYDWPGHKPIVNTNRLLKEGKYKYPRAIGGKTGYTASSGYNLVVAAEDKGRRLIAVLLGCEHSEDRFKDAIALFETAFREKPLVRHLFSKGDDQFSRDVPKSDTQLRGRLEEDLNVSYFLSEEGKLNAHILWHKLRLPVKEGAQVGNILVEDAQGNEVASSPLYAANRVEKTLYYKWIDFFRSSLFLLCFPASLLLYAFLKLHKKGRKGIK